MGRGCGVGGGCNVGGAVVINIPYVSDVLICDVYQLFHLEAVQWTILIYPILLCGCGTDIREGRTLSTSPTLSFADVASYLPFSSVVVSRKCIMPPG